MVELKDDTEKQILSAAEEEFVQNGLAGARMQSIANRAGINKSLLHYYFRTKEKLFTFVFSSVFKRVIPRIENLLNKDEPLLQKIERFVVYYMDIISKNPFIPVFILHELNKNPERIANLIQSAGLKPTAFIQQVEESIQKEEIIDISPYQLITNVVALSIFPFIARPILQGLVFEGDKKKYAVFLEERKKEVPKFIINAIKK